MSAKIPADSPAVEAIEADDLPPSAYSDLESLASSTQSLTSSIQEHVYQNGRRYHRKTVEDGGYALPSDEVEQGRLDLMHHIYTILYGGDLHKSNLDSEKLHNVLDLGTGTGVWALDFGELHPAARVFGVDLMPIQPSWTLPNVKFEIDDLEKEWTWQKDSFDFIHSRTIMTAIRDRPRFFEQCFAHTIPGGRIELLEHNLDVIRCDDGTVEVGSPLEVWFKTFGECLTKSGIDAKMTGDELAEGLRNAGYVDVEVKPFKVPFGGWAKEKNLKLAGRLVIESLRTGMEAYALHLMVAVGGFSEKEAKDVINKAFAQLLEGKAHGYVVFWAVLGRKPE